MGIITRNIYSGKVLVLNIETVTLPNGQRPDMEVIHHPGASAIVPVKDDGTIVMLRQFRHAAGGFIYEIPAGKLDPGEDPLTCAARELEEEIGYRPSQLDFLTSIFPAPGYTDEVIHIYQGTGLIQGTQHLDQDEVLEIIEWPLDKAIAQIYNGTIQDAKSIIGLQMVYWRNLEAQHTKPPSTQS